MKIYASTKTGDFDAVYNEKYFFSLEKAKKHALEMAIANESKDFKYLNVYNHKDEVVGYTVLGTEFSWVEIEVEE